MASPAISGPYICPRCTMLLRSQQSASRRSLLFARTRRSNHTDAFPHDSERVKKVPFHTRFAQAESPARAATLKSTSLGASASILILNDTGRKRGQRRDAPGLEEVVPSEHNASRIIEIIEKTAKLPGQEEVNRSIEALRPDDLPTLGERLFIPRKRFDHVTAGLLQRFNLGQLSRYVTIKQGARLAELQKQTAPPSCSVGQSQWRIDGTSSHNARYTPKQVKLTGKKAVVDALLRIVWQLDVEEETMAEGMLEMYPQKGILQLLTLQGHGHTSKLGRISQGHQVRVEVSSGIIEIYGRESACIKASHEIKLAAVDATEMAFRLDPFSDDSHARVLSNTQALDKVASRCGAVLDHAATGKKITIIAESRVQAQRCKKMLLRHLFAANTPQAIMVYSPNSSSSSANLIEAVAPSSNAVGTWHSAIAMNLARGDTPVLMKPKFPILSDETVSMVLNSFQKEHSLQANAVQDRPSASADATATAKAEWATDSKTRYGVEMGQISFGGVGRFNKPINPQFDATVPGLSQFFLAEFRDCIPSSKTYFTTDWVVSPWDNPNLPISAIEQVPQIRMILLPNASTGGFDMNSVVAVAAAPRTIYLPIPNAGVDWKITEREQIEVLNPLQDADLASVFDSFNKEARLVGFEKAQLSETMRIRVPQPLLPLRAIDQLTGKDGQNDSSEIVFTALPSILTQKISVPYDGLSLEYQSIYGGETASTYSLSLQMSLESSTTSPAEAEVAQRKLFAVADKLSCRLSSAIGPFKIPPAIAREAESRPRSVAHTY